MTDSHEQKPPPNKRPKFIYRGPNKSAENMIFELLESPVKEGDEWKNGEEKLVYLWSLDRYMQPENTKDSLCDYRMGALEDDVIINAYIPKVDLSKKMGESGEADSVAGGFITMETEENFKKFYHKIGKK